MIYYTRISVRIKERKEQYDDSVQCTRYYGHNTYSPKVYYFYLFNQLPDEISTNFTCYHQNKSYTCIHVSIIALENISGNKNNFTL